MADRTNISISNNAAWAGTWTLYDSDDAVRDLTGATFEMDIRETPEATAEIATLTTGNGRVSLSATPTDGTVSILIPLAVAAAIDPGLYYHDMIMTLGGVTERIWFGTLRVVEGVTR